MTLLIIRLKMNMADARISSQSVTLDGRFESSPDGEIYGLHCDKVVQNSIQSWLIAPGKLGTVSIKREQDYLHWEAICLASEKELAVTALMKSIEDEVNFAVANIRKMEDNAIAYLNDGLGSELSTTLFSDITKPC